MVPGHCASEILIVRIIGELYAQVSFFPTMYPEMGDIAKLRHTPTHINCAEHLLTLLNSPKYI